uniref:Bucky ball n=2 Tax=Denticeps clupeoides TaxID=299321 RepID=A0AAY4A1L4_9TELE
MEDISSPSHSLGVGQPHQHAVNHTRPFFYVQPPSQPYYMYQWNMSPYGHCGFPGSALPFGRPFMTAYQYMQLPGYVVPHAPIQPIDYRRIGTPHFPTTAVSDICFRSQLEQCSVRRETSCSEAQTDPSDMIGMLTDRLDNLKTSEKPEELTGLSCERSPPTQTGCSMEEEKLGTLNSLGELSLPRTLHFANETLDAPANLQSTFTESSPAVPPIMSAQGRFDWSSFRDDCLTEKKAVSEKVCLVGAKDLKPAVDNVGSHCADKTGKPPDPDSGVYESDVVTHTRDTQATCSSFDGPGGTLGNELGNSSLTEVTADVEDLPYRILRLPCNKATTGLLEKETELLWYSDTMSNLVPRLSSFGSPFYSYYPQVELERQSVLSLSIDELSSREEVFSTDVEDLDHMSGHIYVGGRSMAQETSNLCFPGRKEEPNGHVGKEICAVCQNCVSCGMSLVDQSEERACREFSRSHPVAEELENTEHFNEEYGAELGASSKIRTLVSFDRSLKYGLKRDYCKDQFGIVDLVEQEQGPECCGHKAMARGDKNKGRSQRNAPSKPHSEKQWSERTVASNLESWGGCEGKHRPKPRKPVNGNQEQGRPMHRRASCKKFLQQKPRRKEYDDYEEADFFHFQRGRGSTKKRGTRY